MKPRHPISTGLLLLLLTLAPGAASALQARYSSRSIDIADVTPGGEALYFHASRQSEGYIPSVGIHRGVWLDDDGDGAISQALGLEAPRRAVVVAVDLTSGALTVAAREDSLISRIELPTDGLIANSKGQLSAFRHRREWVEMVVVRPGVGAWKLSAADGGRADLDPDRPAAEPVYDGTVLFSLSQMEAVTGSVQAEPPAEILAGDVLVMIDPRSFELYAVTYEG